MTVWGNGSIPRSVQRLCLESAILVPSSRAKPSIFLAHWYSALCGIAEDGKPLAKGARNDGVQGRFLDYARNDGIGGCITHVSYKGYVGKTLFPKRHSDRSGGILLAYRYIALCEIAEKGKPLAKGARKSGVQERFLATLEMTVWCISPYAR